MKLANQRGRAVLVFDDRVTDVADASDGRFGPDVMSCYEQWDDFVEFGATVTSGTDPLAESELGNPVPLPRQIFAIGLNYAAHAEESGMEQPKKPAVFTKFLTSLTGPFDDVPLRGTSNDWEVELVVVLGKRCEGVSRDDAWECVAGFTIGQDISDRHLQFAAGGQFSLGKSRTGYGPVGPWVVTLDELDDPSDLGLGCSINGETVQDARTNDLIFDIPALIEELSSVTALLPGDLIFTGTPSGIGIVRQPPRFLQPDDVLESWIEGIGVMRNTMVG